jgi:hypothetical protein
LTLQAENSQLRVGSASRRASTDGGTSIELARTGAHAQAAAAGDDKEPVPLRERSWGDRSSGGTGGEDPVDLEAGKRGAPRRPRSICWMLSRCLKVLFFLANFLAHVFCKPFILY